MSDFQLCSSLSTNLQTVLSYSSRHSIVFKDGEHILFVSPVMLRPLSEHRQLTPQQPSLDEYEYNGKHKAPPVPPLQLDGNDIRSLQLNRPALEAYDIDGTRSSLKSPKLKLRRTSSTGELEESIKHLQVQL